MAIIHCPPENLFLLPLFHKYALPYVLSASPLALEEEGTKITGISKILSHLASKGTLDSTANSKRISEVASLKNTLSSIPLLQQKETETGKEPLDLPDVLILCRMRREIIEASPSKEVEDAYFKHQASYTLYTKEPPIDRELLSSIRLFYQLDVRAGEIEELSHHPHAESLYMEKVRFEKEERVILSGLRGKVPEDLMLHHSFLFALNLKPSALKGITSYGMILCVSDDTGIEPIGTGPLDRGARLELEAFPPLPHHQTPRHAKRNVLEQFLAALSVKDNILLFNNHKVTINGKPVTTKIKEGGVR